MKKLIKYILIILLSSLFLPILSIFFTMIDSQSTDLQIYIVHIKWTLIVDLIILVTIICGWGIKWLIDEL